MASKRTKAGFFPREPDASLPGQLKALDRAAVEELLGPEGLEFFKTKPFLHQLVSVVLGIVHDGWLFALDMGLGKSKIGVDVYTFRRHFGEVRQCLVTCPPIVMHHWKNQVRLHSDWSAIVCEGTAAEKFDILRYAEQDFIIVSHPWLVRVMSEALAEPPTIDPDAVFEACGRYDMLVVDEAHSVGSPSSKGFIGYDIFLSPTRYRYLLTGTPIGNDYTKIWALYYLVDRGKTYGKKFAGFMRKWFTTFVVRRPGSRGRGWPSVRLRAARKQEFFDLFWQRAVRWEEGECSDLPPKSYVTIPVALNSQQAKAYLKEVDGDCDTNVLQEITGGIHESLSGKHPSAKLEALEYLVNEHVIERGEQILVWHWRVEEGELIARTLRERFPKLRVGEARGNITATTKKKYLEAWHKNKLDVFVANPASLGIGVDLYEARVAVYYSNGFKLIDRKQSEKRTHRTGQKRHCLYIDLVCSGTVDEYILETLEDSQDAFVGLTKDQVRDAVRKVHTPTPQQGKLL